MKGLNEKYRLKKVYFEENSNKKDSLSFIKNIYLNYFDKILIIINIILYLLYIISLEDCNKGEEDGCIDDNIPTYIFQGILVEINAFFYSLEFFFMILKYIKKYHLIYIFIFYSYLFKKKNGYNLRAHGGFNKDILILSLLLFIIIEFFILFLVKLYKRKKFKIFWITIISLIIIPISFNFFIKTITSCDYYQLYLNNTRIINSKKDGCYFTNPKDCRMILYEKIFDLNKIIKKDYNSRKNFMDFVINKNKYQSTRRFGLPYISDNLFLRHPFQAGDLKKFLWNNYIDMDKDTSKIGKPPEFEIIFDKNGKGSLKITVTPNKTLIEERRKLENPNSLLNNILVLFLDTVSKKKFQLDFPLASAWIEKYMKKTHRTSSENEDNSLNAYQFLKYHSVGGHTHINVQPMLYGNSMKSKSGIKINKYFRENGYITGHILDQCNKGLLWDFHQIYTKNIKTVPWDHFGNGIFCDNNYGYNFRSFFKGSSAIIRRSLYGKQTEDLELEYGEKFWNAYLNSRKYLFLAFLHGHEPTYSVVKYLDKPIVDFLNKLEKDNKLKDTGILIVGDHGLHLSPIYAIISPEYYFYQRDLPVLFIVLDYNKNIKIDDLYDNQQKFVTPYDIYESLFHIIFGNNYKKQNINVMQRKSLFKYINETERNCKLYSEIVGVHCKCIIKNENI